MKNKELLDIYSDYLISAFGQTTGTGLAGLLGNSVSHDRIQRLLAQERLGSAELWQVVKPYVRQIEQANGVIIIDDSIAEKPYTDENDIICWHFDHSQNRSVKGINFMTCLYHAGGYFLPVGFTIVAKTEFYLDKKDGKQKRRSPIGKNEHYRDLLRHAKQNQIPFKYVLSDVWYSAADNMTFIKHDLDKDFIMPLKANRKVALSEQAKRAGAWVRLDQVTLDANTPLDGLHFRRNGEDQSICPCDGVAMVTQNRETQCHFLACRERVVWRLRGDGDQSRTSQLNLREDRLIRTQRQIAVRTPATSVKDQHDWTFCEELGELYGFTSHVW
jgi:DDE superfamily endonuclease